MEKMKAVSKSAFGASAFAIVLLLFFASVACFSSIGPVREIMLWLAIVVTLFAMAAGVISGYAAQYSAVLQRIAAARSDIGMLNSALALPDDELEEVTNNRRLIIMTLDGQQHGMEWRVRTAEEIRQAIESERKQITDQLESDLKIPKPPPVAWWERYILPQWAY